MLWNSVSRTILSLSGSTGLQRTHNAGHKADAGTQFKIWQPARASLLGPDHPIRVSTWLNRSRFPVNTFKPIVKMSKPTKIRQCGRLSRRSSRKQPRLGDENGKSPANPKTRLPNGGSLPAWISDLMVGEATI